MTHDEKQSEREPGRVEEDARKALAGRRGPGAGDLQVQRPPVREIPAAAAFLRLLVEEVWAKTAEEQMMNATTIRTSDRIFTMKLELPSPMSEL